MNEFKSKMQFVFQYLNRSISDLMRAGRAIKIYDAPSTPGQTVEIHIKNVETIIKFENWNNNDFDLKLIINDCIKMGDRLFIIFDNPTNGSGEVTIASDNLEFNSCGPDGDDDVYLPDEGVTIIPFIFNCDKFYGLDYC